MEGGAIVRIVLDRQSADRQPPGQHDQDRDDDREDRPLDEELRHGARPIAPEQSGHGALDGAHDHARLHFLHPGYDHPFAFVQSALDHPLVANVRVAWIVRSATLLSGPTTSAVACPCGLCVTPTCGTSIALSSTP